MSFNGSGTFLINSSGQPVVTGTTISSTAFNAFTSDIGTGLTTCLTKDGQSTPTANIKMGNFKLTGLGAPTINGDALSYGSVASLGLHNNLTAASGILSVESTANGIRAAEFMSSNAASGQIAILVRNDTALNYALYCLYGASTNVGSISTTSTATSFNTISDGRMKTNRSAYDPGDLFDRINVHNFTWQHTGTPGIGVIAQELADVCPGWVTPGDDGDGKPGDEGYRMWQTPITDPLAAIMAELKSLRARVAVLEAG